MYTHTYTYTYQFYVYILQIYVFYKYIHFTNIYLFYIHIYTYTHTHTHIYIYIHFFFLLCPRHVEVPRPGTEFDSSDNTESLTTRPPGNSPTVDYCLLCQRLIVRRCVGLFLVNFSFLNFHMK